MADYPFIPRSTFAKMEKLNLYEKDVYDVWFNVEMFKLPNGAEGMKKKYEGWGEIYLLYSRKYNGEYMITHVGTRPRR